MLFESQTASPIWALEHLAFQSLRRKIRTLQKPLEVQNGHFKGPSDSRTQPHLNCVTSLNTVQNNPAWLEDDVTWPHHSRQSTSNLCPMPRELLPRELFIECAGCGDATLNRRETGEMEGEPEWEHKRSVSYVLSAAAQILGFAERKEAYCGFKPISSPLINF